MSYGIARIQKYNAGSVKGIEIHDRRDKNVSHTNKDIDFSRSHLNYELHPTGQELHLRNQEMFLKTEEMFLGEQENRAHLTNQDSQSDLQFVEPAKASNNNKRQTYKQLVNERIQSLDLKRAVRHDAKVMCQVLVTSNKAFFDGLSEERQRQFFENSYKFICGRFGKNNIISATVHLDEKTPHMHVNFVPVTMDGRLSAKDVVGGRTALNRFQTQFYEQVFKGYGLERGIEGSKTRHQSVAEYKASTAKQEVKELEQEAITKRQEILGLEGEVVTKSQEVLGLESEIAAKKQEVLGLQDKRVALQNENIDLHNDNVTLQGVNTILEDKNIKLQSQNENLHSQKITLQNEVVVLQDKKAILEAEKTAIESENSMVELDLSIAQKDLAIIQYETSQAQDTLLKAQNDTLEAQKHIDQYKTTLENLEAKLGALQGDYEGLEKSVSELTAAKDEIQGEINILETHKIGLEGKIIEKQEQLKTLDTNLTGKIKTRQGIENLPIKISKPIFGKEDNITMTRSDYDSLVRTALISPRVETAEKLKAAEQRIEELEPLANRVKPLENQIESLKQQNAGLKQKIKDDDTNNPFSTRMDLARKDAEIANLKRQLGSERNKNKGLIDRISKTLDNIDPSSAKDFDRALEVGDRVLERKKGWGPEL